MNGVKMKSANRILALAAWGLYLWLANTTMAQEWTRFRGPNGTGISTAQGIPSSFSLSEAHWRLRLRGEGHSSPVLWGKRVFVTSYDAVNELFIIQCLNADNGSELWSHSLAQKPYHTHNFNHMASSTPVTDGKRLMVISSEPTAQTMVALDLDGNQLWTQQFETTLSNHGGGVSPIIYDDRVILAGDEDGESFLSALDLATGKVLWKTQRIGTQAAFSTPCEYVDPSGTKGLLFNSSAQGISFVNPNSGKTFWEQGGLFQMRTISSSLVADGLLIGTCGSGGGGNYLVAVNPGNASEGGSPSLAYQLKRSIPYVPTGVAKGKLLFLWGDDGIVTCVTAGNGETVWRERIDGRFFGSPVWLEGRLFCVSAQGQVVVIAASENFEQLATNDLGELTHATPAVANQRLYIRTLGHLTCFGARSSQ